jgi:hypothetical protein
VTCCPVGDGNAKKTNRDDDDDDDDDVAQSYEWKKVCMCVCALCKMNGYHFCLEKNLFENKITSQFMTLSFQHCPLLGIMVGMGENLFFLLIDR